MNISARNCNFRVSRIGKSRCTAKSHCVAPKPRRELRPRLPCLRGFPLASVGGGQNGPMLWEPSGHPPVTAPGVPLIAFPPGNWDPNKKSGMPDPDTTSGRTTVLLFRSVEAPKPIETFTGGADRASTMLCIDQPRKMAFVKAFILGAGMSYVTAAETEFRISKSEEPRFALAPNAGTSELPAKMEPVDASSRECDHV